MKINYLATILIATFGIAANVSEARVHPGGLSTSEFWQPWVVILVGVIAGIFLLGFIADKLSGRNLDKCPKCNEPNAMEWIGRIETKGFFERNLREWKCLHCDHREWKKGPWIESGDNDGGP